MSAGAQTKIFGIRLGLDPKILVGVLVAAAALSFWYNSRGDEQAAHPPAAAPTVQPATAVPAAPTSSHATGQRRRGSRADRGTLQFHPVDATRGDVDPVLRLDLLTRLANVHSPGTTRNLFEAGPVATAAPQTGTLPVRIIPVRTPAPPAPVTPAYPTPSQLSANIPYKYYGFAKPEDAGQPNQGLFLEGDNILVASEGQMIQQRYLVVQLTPTNARLEDTQIKMGQTLPVVPEAMGQ